MNLFDTFFRRGRERRAYGNLLQLDDHLLRDIGVTRDEVRRMMADDRTARRATSRREG